MAGSISLSLTQQFDKDTGALLSGGRLYFYAANTSTPQNAFRDSGLTEGQEHPNPLTLDAGARVPMLYFADGFIRVRMLNEAGIVQFDEANLMVVGPSSGEAGEDTTDPNSIASTGDVKWRPSTGTLSGWVRINGRTIGSASSGATERANADTQSLYEYLWANFSDTLCPVTGGRGASSTADFDANKPIALLDMRGRSPFGVADMGSSDSARLDSVTFGAGDKTTGGSSGGAGTRTIAQGNLPNVNLTTSIASGQGSHTHPSLSSNPLVSNGLSSGNDGGSGLIGTTSAVTVTANTLPAMTGTTPLGGSGTALQTMPPFAVGTWYFRL